MERLEARLAVVVAGAALVVALARSGGRIEAADTAGVAQELRAQSFVVVDKAGTKRAWLRVEDDGVVLLSFYESAKDGKADARLTLGISPTEGPTVGLYDAEHGKTRVLLELPKNGQAGVLVLDPACVVRARMGADKDGTGVVIAGSREARVGLIASKQDAAVNLFLGEATRACLGVSTDTEPFLQMKNAKGKVTDAFPR